MRAVQLLNTIDSEYTNRFLFFVEVGGRGGLGTIGCSQDEWIFGLGHSVAICDCRLRINLILFSAFILFFCYLSSTFP